LPFLRRSAHGCEWKGWGRLFAWGGRTSGLARIFFSRVASPFRCSTDGPKTGRTVFHDTEVVGGGFALMRSAVRAGRKAAGGRGGEDRRCMAIEVGSGGEKMAKTSVRLDRRRGKGEVETIDGQMKG